MIVTDILTNQTGGFSCIIYIYVQCAPVWYQVQHVWLSSNTFHWNTHVRNNWKVPRVPFY